MSYFFDERRLADAKRISAALPVGVVQVYYWLAGGFTEQQIVMSFRLNLSPHDVARMNDATAKLKR